MNAIQGIAIMTIEEADELDRFRAAAAVVGDLRKSEAQADKESWETQHRKFPIKEFWTMAKNRPEIQIYPGADDHSPEDIRDFPAGRNKAGIWLDSLWRGLGQGH